MICITTVRTVWCTANAAHKREKLRMRKEQSPSGTPEHLLTPKEHRWNHYPAPFAADRRRKTTNKESIFGFGANVAHKEATQQINRKQSLFGIPAAE